MYPVFAQGQTLALPRSLRYHHRTVPSQICPPQYQLIRKIVPSQEDNPQGSPRRPFSQLSQMRIAVSVLSSSNQSQYIIHLPQAPTQTACLKATQNPLQAIRRALSRKSPSQILIY